MLSHPTTRRKRRFKTPTNTNCDYMPAGVLAMDLPGQAETPAVEKDRPAVAARGGAVYGAPDGGRQGHHQDHLAALAADPQHPVAMLLPAPGFLYGALSDDCSAPAGSGWEEGADAPDQ